MINNARRRIGLAGLVFLLIGVSISLCQRADANHATFAPGDVFIALKTSGGEVQWRHPDGTLNKIIIGQVPGPASAVGFNSSGNLFVTRLCVDGNCQQHMVYLEIRV